MAESKTSSSSILTPSVMLNMYLYNFAQIIIVRKDKNPIKPYKNKLTFRENEEELILLFRYDEFIVLKFFKSPSHFLSSDKIVF
jgi:hypothetical protein